MAQYSVVLVSLFIFAISVETLKLKNMSRKCANQSINQSINEFIFSNNNKLFTQKYNLIRRKKE